MSDTPRPSKHNIKPTEHNIKPTENNIIHKIEKGDFFDRDSGYDSGRHSYNGSHQCSRSHSKERIIEPATSFIDSPEFLHNGILQPPVVRPQYPNGINTIPYPFKPHNPPYRDV